MRATDHRKDVPTQVVGTGEERTSLRRATEVASDTLSFPDSVAGGRAVGRTHGAHATNVGCVI